MTAMDESTTTYKKMSAPSVAESKETISGQQPHEHQAPDLDLKPRNKFKSVLFGLGIAEIVLGCISITLGIAATIIKAKIIHLNHPTYSSEGIWCGMCLLISGVLGYKAKANASVKMFHANLILSVVGACAMIFLAFLSTLHSVVHRMASARYQYIYISPTNNYSSILAPVHTTVAVLGFVGLIVCVVHFGYCCAGICCRKKGQHQVPVAYVANPYPGFASGQITMVPVHGMPSTIAQGHLMVPHAEVLDSVPHDFSTTNAVQQNNTDKLGVAVPLEAHII